jgi:hypothetical protein
MLRRVALVATDVYEERIDYIIKKTKIGELGTLAVTSNRRPLLRNIIFRSVRRLLVTVNYPSSPILVTPDDGGAKFLRNVCSYKRHTA